MTPRQFEILCGLEKSRDWRRTIHYEGDTLKALIQRNILRPHAQVRKRRHFSTKYQSGGILNRKRHIMSTW